MKLILPLLLVFFFLSSCNNEVSINDKLAISRWNNEGYSLNFNDNGSWLGIIEPNITNYDLQNNILILERISDNEKTDYYLINLDSLNYPRNLTSDSISKKEFKNKIEQLRINYNPKKL